MKKNDSEHKNEDSKQSVTVTVTVDDERWVVPDTVVHLLFHIFGTQDIITL